MENKINKQKINMTRHTKKSKIKVYKSTRGFILCCPKHLSWSIIISIEMPLEEIDVSFARRVSIANNPLVWGKNPCPFPTLCWPPTWLECAGFIHALCVYMCISLVMSSKHLFLDSLTLIVFLLLLPHRFPSRKEIVW